MNDADAPRVRQTLEKSVKLILDAQNRAGKEALNQGGWRYQPDSIDSDLSVTGWQLIALQAAKDAGVEVPQGESEVPTGQIEQ